MSERISDERATVLLNWLDENGGTFTRELDLTTAAGGAPLIATGIELDWLAQEWRRTRDAEEPESAGVGDRAVTGTARTSREPVRSSAPETYVHTDEGAVIDAETGEVVDEDIPFTLPGDDATVDTSDDPGNGALALRSESLVSMFGSYGPNAALELVERYADAFKAFVKAHDLTLEMEDGADYVLAPGWEALGQLTGVFTEVEWTRPVQGGFEARAFAHQPKTGERWGSREAICLRSESGRKYKPDAELHAMAQTRACRNALRSSLSVIVNAAGFDSAPPEERTHSPRQRAMLFALFQRLEKLQPRGRDGWKNVTTDKTLARYGKRISALNRKEMSETIDRVARYTDALAAAPKGERDDVPDEDDDVVREELA